MLAVVVVPAPPGKEDGSDGEPVVMGSTPLSPLAVAVMVSVSSSVLGGAGRGGGEAEKEAGAEDDGGTKE